MISGDRELPEAHSQPSWRCSGQDPSGPTKFFAVTEMETKLLAETQTFLIPTSLQEAYPLRQLFKLDP